MFNTIQCDLYETYTLYKINVKETKTKNKRRDDNV